MRKAKKLGLNVDEWRFGKTRKNGRGLTLEDAEILRKDRYFQTPLLAEAEITISGVAAILSSNLPTVKHKAEELGLSIFERRARGQIASSIAREDFEKLKLHPFYQIPKDN